MIGYGAAPPLEFSFEHENLTYVTKEAMDALMPAYQSGVLQFRGVEPTFHAQIIPTIPDPGKTGWDALEHLATLGYVSLVNKKNKLDLVISKVAKDIRSFAGDGKAYAVLLGPETLIDEASKVEPENTAFWSYAAFGAASLFAFFLLRK